jgi:hypothetical protein
MIRIIAVALLFATPAFAASHWKQCPAGYTYYHKVPKPWSENPMKH